ncbi:MAG: DinB family protein [Promethearchaeota archaeon]
MEFVHRLFEYLSWADKVVFGVVAKVSEEEGIAPIGAYSRSIRDICVHLAYDYWEWLVDVSDEDWEEPKFSAMSVKTILAFIEGIQQRWWQYFRELESEGVLEIGSGCSLSVMELVFHLVNHATYHRGQLVLALRMLGRDVPMTDYVPFVKRLS